MNEHGSVRQFQRYSLTVPVEFRGVRGVTRNVSLGGIYFESTAAEVAAGTAIRFSLVFQQEDAPPLRLDCDGTVVRVEELSGGQGIAATIDCFESIIAAITPVPYPSRSESARRDH